MAKILEAAPKLTNISVFTMIKKYLLSGNDEYRNQEFIDYLKQEIDPNWLELNYHEVVLTSETSPEETLARFIGYIREIPLGWGRKVVVIKGDLKLEGGEEDNNESVKEATAKRLNLIEELILAEEDNTTVVFVSNPDKRTKIGKLMSGACERVEFLMISEWRTNDIAEIVAISGSKHGLTLPSNVCKYIAEAVGNDQRRIAREVEKLVMCRGEGTLRLLEVRELIPSLRHSSIELSQLIREKKAASVRALSQTLLESTHPLSIVAALTTIFRTWTKLKAALTAQVTDDRQLASIVEVKNPGRVYYLKLEVESVSLKRLVETTIELFELETSLKNGLDPKTLPEKLMKLVVIKD